jgi:hypothetical protein
MTAVLKDSTGRDLVSEDLFDQLVSRIEREQGFAVDLASRIVNQALAFLAASAESPVPLSPSHLVDFGWHAFILHTKEYAAFCDRVAGHFLHHDPTPLGVTPSELEPQENLDRSVRAVEAAGFAVEPDLWQVTSAKCSQCQQGCTHSGGNTGCHHHPVRTDSVPA